MRKSVTIIKYINAKKNKVAKNGGEKNHKEN